MICYHQRMMGYSSSSFNQPNSLGIMDDLQEQEALDSISSCSSSSIEVSGVVSSAESDHSLEDVTSSASSSSSHASTSPTGPLNDMSSLLHQLPFKRGLSNYYQGKSQSFTSLANVKCLEDLAKPENPYNKKLKTCRSYGGGLSSQSHRSSQFARWGASTRLISKKPSRGSFSSLGARRPSTFHGNRPPVPVPVPVARPPHGSTSTITFSNQTPLFIA